MKVFVQFLALAISALVADGFSTYNMQSTSMLMNNELAATLTTSWSSESEPVSSRRAFFNNAILATASAAVLTIAPTGAEAKANEVSEATLNPTFQGVYADPNHPNGYRVLIVAPKGGAYMTLSDGVPKGSDDVAQTYRKVPVKVSGNKLSFDFSFKKGPTSIEGVLAQDGNSIEFTDGNVWKKNIYEYDGVYKDALFPKGYRVLRKQKGSTIEVELMQDATNPKEEPIFFKAKHQSLLAIPTVAIRFDFPGGQEIGKPLNQMIGSLYLKGGNTIAPPGTIDFPDGNRWTKL